MFVTCLLLTMTSAVATPTKRQNPPASPTTASSATQHVPLSLEVAIPVAVVAGLTILALAFYYRKGLAEKWSKFFSYAAVSTESTRPVTSTITAEELATGTPSRSRAPRTAPAAVASRERRWVQRTTSGSTIRTLPAYTKQAADEELVLVRQRSDSTFSDDDPESGDLQRVPLTSSPSPPGTPSGEQEVTIPAPASLLRQPP
ncbi:hypothetical protein P7C73_g6844, partial [Tremellales sp. Uapishka_1]